MVVLEDIFRLERQASEAWPAFEEARRGGWLLRFSQGVYMRSNSVYPLGKPEVALREAVAEVEGWYRTRGVRPVFKVTNAHEDLSRSLQELGYQAIQPSLVLVGPIPQGNSDGARIASKPSPEWIRTYLAVEEPRSDAAFVERLLSLLERPTAFGLVEDGGVAAAVGMGVVTEETLWIFSVGTLTGSRRQGFSTRVLNGLGEWGRQQGASRAALQVFAANAGAIALYSGLGFERSHAYRYMAKG